MAVLGRSNPNQRFDALFEVAKRARLPWDKEAWLNLAFWMGEQYVEWADSASTIRRIPRQPDIEHTPRPISNKIKHFVLQEHAMVLQTRPTVDVLAASEDPGDISSAAVALAWLTWLTEPQVADFDSELSNAVLWALASTEGYLKWVWNPRLKRPDVISCSPLDIYLDPYTKKFKDCRYIIHSQFMDTEQVFDIYGKDVKPTDTDRADPVKVALMREMGMAPVLQGCVVNELWMKPCRRHPEGIFVVWTNRDQLVEPTKFPYDHHQLPFTQVGSIPRPGTPHCTSAVSDLRAPQMELNKFHAQMILTRQSFANPKWWVPDELELESLPDDSPNQVLRGNSNNGMLEPKLIQPSAMPPNDQGKWISTEMMDVVGIHDVSQGQVPGRVEAAKAIELLRESDDGRLAEMLRSIKSAISIGFWQFLQLNRQYGSAEQVVQTYSRDGMPEVKRFMRQDVKAGMIVKVTMGTGLARSRAARQDQLMLMWENGIIQDKELMAELLEVPMSSVSPSNAYDIRLARNENFQMADDIAIVPNSWDNHEIHKREHNDYRKTQEFAELPNKVKQKFEFHVETHDQLEIQQLGKQLQIQQMSAAVAQGAGFQMGGGGADQGGADQGGAPLSGGGGGGGEGGGSTPPVPAAAGAHPQTDPYAVRDSPQGQASYQNRYAHTLHHPQT